MVQVYSLSTTNLTLNNNQSMNAPPPYKSWIEIRLSGIKYIILSFLGILTLNCITLFQMLIQRIPLMTLYYFAFQSFHFERT